MSVRNVIVGAAAACVLSLTAAWPVQAQLEWKFAVTSRPGSILYDLHKESLTQINKNLGGKIVLKEQFVGNQQEMTQQVQLGRLEMAASSATGSAAAVPEGTVLSLLYLWDDDEERAWVTDKHALPILQEIYRSKGMELLQMADAGWSNVFCKFECDSPAKVKGRKARVSPAQSSKLFWQGVGANGVQMPLTDFFTGLQQGLVEAGDLQFLYYITTPAAEVAKHYVLTKHLHHPSVYFVNKAKWAALTPEQQKAIRDGLVPPNEQRRRAAADEEPAMDKWEKDGKGKIYRLTPAQREEWAKLVRPYTEQLLKSIGGRSQEVYDAVIAGKKAYAEMKAGKTPASR